MSTLVLTQAWKTEFQNVSAANDAVGIAKEALLVAEQALGAHLNPGDQTPGEHIFVWVPVDATDERLVRSRLKKDGLYAIDFRGQKRPL